MLDAGFVAAVLEGFEGTLDEVIGRAEDGFARNSSFPRTRCPFCAMILPMREFDRCGSAPRAAVADAIRPLLCDLE